MDIFVNNPDLTLTPKLSANIRHHETETSHNVDNIVNNNNMHILNEVVQEIEEAKASEETYYIYDETESINNTNNYSIILNDDILDEDAIEVKIENISDDIIRLNNNNGLHNTSPNVIIDSSSSTNELYENNSTNNQSSVSSSIILCSDSS